MIVVKNVPGLTTGELIATLRAVWDPEDRAPRTGDGGVVVGERTALSWLSLYIPSVTPPPEPPPLPPTPPAPVAPPQPPPPPAAIRPEPKPVVQPEPPESDEPDPPKTVDEPAQRKPESTSPRPRKRAPRKTTTTRAGGRHGGDL